MMKLDDDSRNFTDAENAQILSTALELICKAVVGYFASKDKDFDLKWEELYGEYVVAAFQKHISLLPKNGRQDN